MTRKTVKFTVCDYDLDNPDLSAQASGIFDLIFAEK